MAEERCPSPEQMPLHWVQPTRAEVDGAGISSVDVILDQAGACAVFVSGVEDVGGLFQKLS